MKKFLLLFLIAVLSMPLMLNAQLTATFGTGTTSSSTGGSAGSPMSSGAVYSYTQSIYTAAELSAANVPAGATIIALEFYNGTGESVVMESCCTYMGLRSTTSFTSATDYTPYNQLTFVDSSDWVSTGLGWFTVNLSTPFTWDGTSNLLVAVTYGGAVVGDTNCGYNYTDQTENRHWRRGCRITDGPVDAVYASHADWPGGTSPSGGSFTTQPAVSDKRPNLRITYILSGCPSLPPTVANIGSYSADLSWINYQQSAYSWNLMYGETGTFDTLSGGTAITGLSDTSYSLTGLTSATTYSVYLKSYCSSETGIWSTPSTFTTTAACPTPTGLILMSHTAEEATISWQPGANETGWEVVCVPHNAPVGSGTPVYVTSSPYTFTNLIDNTQYDLYVRADCGNGEHSYWTSPVTFTTDPYCTPPTNITAEQVMATSALITWGSAPVGATGYTVGYSEAGMDNWTTFTSITGNSYMLSGLSPSTEYDVFVFSECVQGQVDTIFTSLETSCMSGGDPFTEGTTTTYLLPLNNYYNYTYSQQIYLASEMGGAATIDSIAFEYAYATAMTSKTNVTIYLGHTTQSTFTSSSNYIPSTNLQQVYTGSLNCSHGWNTFVLSTPFQYNGTDNLVLVVDDNSGDYDGTAYTFRAHNAGATRSLYFYSDSYNPDPTNPTSTSASSSTVSNRSNVKFFIPCDNTATCLPPNVYVSEFTDESITINWAPGYSETSWELEYSTDASTWTSEGTVSTSPYTISSLTSNTLYYIRIRSICGSDNSSWNQVSQRTACTDLATLPFIEDFDSYTGSTSSTLSVSNLPYCWSYINEGTSTSYSGYPIIYTSATYAASGSNSLRFYTYITAGTYDDQYAILPPIDTDVNPMNTLQLSLDARAMNTSYTFTLDVGVMTNPMDRNTFVTIQTLNLTSTTYANYEIPFNQYQGTGKYIAIRASQPTTGYNYGYVDNIRVELIPACPKPINVTSPASTTNSVTLNWTETGTATSWIVTYGPAGFAPGTSVAMTETAYSLPFTVNGLNASTMYDFYVQSDCDGSNLSNMSNVISVATQCDVISTLPLMENFDAYTSSNPTTTNNLPYCWSHLNNGTTYTGYPIIYTSATYAQSGSNSMRFYTYTTSSYGDQIAILPQIDVNTLPMNTLQLTFDARQYSSSYTFNLVVGVMTSPTDASTFVPVQTVAVTSTAYSTFEVPFTQYTGTGSYIAIKAPKPTSGYNYGNVDNIILDAAPLCAKPTNVYASNITATGADIDWLPGGNETDWEMVVVPSGMSIALGTPEPVSTRPYLLTNLNDNTAYDVYVRADCGTGTDFSSWSPVCTFSTTPLCSAPTNVTVSQITGTSALLTWTEAIFGATGYTVAYTETGQNNWVTQSVTGNSYMLSGLTTETPYTVTITSECNEGTAPVVTKTFTTHCLAGGEIAIGNGTSTSTYIPSYSLYNYGYSQQIFLSSEIGGPSNITSISMNMSALSQQRNFKIYLAHTSQTNLSSGWASTAGAQKVFDSQQTLHTGWNTFDFTTPFAYNGTDNLLLIIRDSTGSYVSGNSWYTHSTTESRARYMYQDSGVYPLVPSSSTSGTSLTARNNVIFGGNCDPTVTCIAPNVYVSDATENSITLNWAPGNNESSWELETSTDNATWTSQGTVTSSPYTLNNLNSSTLYYFRLRSVCGNNEYSNWVTISHYTECTAISSVPYLENFDSYPGLTTTTSAVNNLPYCWSYLNIGTSASYSGFPIVYTSATYAASGNNSLKFYTYTTSGTYDDQIAILPQIDVNTLPINTLQISFDARNYSSYNFTVEVGVMTDPTNKATFMPISSITTTSSTYTNYEIPLSLYTGTGSYIAFKVPKTTSYNAGFIDNVRVEAIPSCPKPTNVTATTSTTTSVTLNWTENGTATSWIVTYGPAGFAPGTSVAMTETAYSLPFTVNGLNASTMYDFYVQSDCDGSNLSNMSNVISVATQCDVISTLPLMENFDAYTSSNPTTTNNLPYCWSHLNNGTTYTGYPIIYTSATYAQSGSNSMRFYTYTTSSYGDQIAILPQIDVNTLPMNTLQLTFDARQYSSSYTFNLVVGVMTNPTSASTFVPVQTVAVTSTSYNTFEVPLTQYTGTGSYIAIKAPKPTSGYNYGNVDNIIVDVAPLCDKPTSVTASNITATGAEINWMPGGSETDWEIVVVPSGMSIALGTPETVSAHPHTLTNLNDNTAYDVYVRADCGTGTDFSSWSQKCTFTTHPFCSAPTDVTVSQVAGSSALLTWTEAIYGATGYTVEYTETGSNNWISQSVTGNSYMLTGLTPQTAYTVKITSECDQGTAPAVTRTFTTGCLSGGALQIGYGTSTTDYFPNNALYEYSYTQQIFLASEIGNASPINSISFEATTVDDPTRNLQVYLMHTTSASGSSWLSATSAQQVYSGNFTFSTGWNTINFTTPFQYNGTDNLAVIVVDVTGTWTSSNYFRSHTTTQSLCRYVYQDDTPYSITNPPSSGTSTSTRNNVKFGLPCDNTVTCVAPNAYVTGVTENSLTLNWAPGYTESSWEIEISTDDSTWTPEGTVTTMPYTINNLSPSTLYYVHLRSVCGGGDYSGWVTVSERTDCAPITSVPYTENLDSYTSSNPTTTNNLPYCWSYLNNGTTYAGYPIIYSSATYAASGNNSIRFYTYASSSYGDQIAILPAINVNTVPMNTLQISLDARNSSTYTFTLEVGIMTDPTNEATFTSIGTITTTSNTYTNYEIPFNQYTGAGTYIALKAPKPTTSYNSGYIDNISVEPIPACPKPTDVHAVSVSPSSIELGWTEPGTATSWVIEYGPAGFTHGSGTEVNANTNPFTVSGLTTATAYDFYIKSACGGGDYSNYTSVFSKSTECDAIMTLPYTENFDSYSTGNAAAYPDCWSKYTTYTASTALPYCSATHYEGTGSLYFYVATSGTYNMAILRAFDASIPINTLQATFMYRGSSSTDRLIVGVMTNPVDPTTFVPVDTVYPTTSSASTWAEREVLFNTYTGSGQYIAFKNEYTTAACYSYVDNLYINLIPTCPKPQNLHVVNATSNSIELGWTETGSATTWEIAYGDPGFDPDSTTATVVTATSNPFTISNLNTATTYEFRVRALCSATDISYWSSSLQGSTTLVPVGLPYTADFSTNDAWVLNNGSCTNYWVKGTYNNTPALFVTNNGTTPEYSSSSTAVAALKLFTVGTADTVTISFDIMVDGEGSFDYFKLFLAPPSQQFPASASTATPTSTNYWYHDYSVNAYNFYDNGYGTQSSHLYVLNKLTSSIHVTAKMPNPNTNPTAASTALMALVWRNDGSVLYNPPATITNLSVTTNGSGPVITNPTVTTNAATAITTSGATLHATITNPDGVTITAKGFEWKATTGGTYTQIAGTGANNGFSANLTGLTPSTSYTFRAFITYNGTTVTGNEQTFTTLDQGVDPCNTPTNLSVGEITGESIAISWDADANVNSWNIQYRPVGGQLSSATSNTNSYTIHGLVGGTEYQIQVQANCGGGNVSEWTNAITATTTGIDSWLSNSVSLYPNPAKEYVDIRVDGDLNVKTMEVYDVYGKIVRDAVETRCTTSLQTTRINVSGLANGMYFVRVTTEEGMVTKTFVKR